MLLNPTSLTFSGHETFVLRSNWLKKAYDLLQTQPDLFSLPDSFVRLGVGKNMAQSIRFWGRACGIFERLDGHDGYKATWLGHALFNDSDGWDPFLVTPTSRWLLHWQIVSRPEAAFTWYYTFNLLRRGEFTSTQLAQQILHTVAERGGKLPSAATLSRDIDCMLRCYVRPDAAHLGGAIEDALHCPLHELSVIHTLPDQAAYRLASGAQPHLSDQLVTFAALQQARVLKRATVSFNELAFGERSPGRIFRLDEDTLLARLLHFETVTHGNATFSETGGIRQISWRARDDQALDRELLEEAFAQEHRYV